VQGLDQFVRTWAGRTPASLAVSSPEGSVTYRELDDLANRIAHALTATGLAAGDRVGIHLEKSARGIAGMLGALRAGGVYVPIDPSSPPPRAALITSDCDIRHLLISSRHLARWEAAAVSNPVRHFFLTDDQTPGAVSAASAAQVHPWPSVLASPATPSAPRIPGPDDLAYLLYTSGSTGVPKGVMISQRNALAFIEWAGDLAGLTTSDKVASHAPFHFDLSVFDIYSTLRAGATVVLLDEAIAASPTGMMDRIQAAGITVWYSVPSALMLMLERGSLEERGAPSLRVVYFAGEVFPIKHLRRVMLALPGARFFNLFGPTETNVCLYYEVTEPPAEDAAPVPAGDVACGDRALILGEDGRPVADGEIGELFIEGPTVMLGYWDGGRRTPARHPYPTGDRVSRGQDGFIRYHGRRDHMIKVRGYRIELGEVETALLKHSAVREVVSLASDQKLIVVIVPSDDTLTVLDVKRHCAGVLPPYMVPHEIRLVRALPRTSTGKVDRVLVGKAVAAGHLDWQAVAGTPPPSENRQ
jgi:amino acid adenylation domain-containing protein